MSTDALGVVLPPAMASSPTPGQPLLRIGEGHTLLLDERDLQHCHSFHVQCGLLRVSISERDALEPGRSVTLGFLCAGDHLPLDLLRRSWLHLEALTPVVLEAGVSQLPAVGSASLNDWTVALLLVRHLGDAEQRLLALVQLLAERLGRRCGPWVDLPLPLTHGRLAELIGHTRVTVTRQMSRWRQAGLIAVEPSPEGGLRLSPRLLEQGRPPR